MPNLTELVVTSKTLPNLHDNQCFTGGLIGFNESAKIFRSMAVGSITQDSGGLGLGGLVGRSEDNALGGGLNLELDMAVSKVDLKGTVNSPAGGFVGVANGKISIRNSYVLAGASLTGNADLGGMFGNITATGDVTVDHTYIYEVPFFDTASINHAVDHAALAGGGVFAYTNVLAYKATAAVAVDGTVDMTDDFAVFQDKLFKFTIFGDMWSGSRLSWEAEDVYTAPYANGLL